MKKWTDDFKSILYSTIEALPPEVSLSFSGGVDSSMLLFAMIDLGRPPTELITFEIVGEYSKDLDFARKTAHYYGLPLRVAQIPSNPPKKDFQREIKDVLKETRVSRSIDTQVSYAYSYMTSITSTDHLVLGFYEDLYNPNNKKNSVMYSNMLKGKITKKEFDSWINQERIEIYQGKVAGRKTQIDHNYIVISNYIESKGIQTICPLRNQEMLDHCLKKGFEDLMFDLNGKRRSKWFIKDIILKKYFDRHKTNISNFHTSGKEGGLKSLHQRVLLRGSPYKDTRSVYNKILKDIEFEESAYFLC